MRNFGLLTGVMASLSTIATAAKRAGEETRRFSQSIDAARSEPTHRSRGKGRGDLPNGRFTTTTKGKRHASLKSRSRRQKAAKRAKHRRRA